MINKTMESLKKWPIKCYRYSNKLGQKLHVPEKYNARLSLSEDGKELILMTKKYTNQGLYQLETQKAKHLHSKVVELKDLNKGRLTYKDLLNKTNKKKKRKMKTLKGFLQAIRGELQSESSEEHDIETDDEISDDEDDPRYTWVKSKYSCDVDDILSIIVGGMSSKFWQLRKHLNQIHPNDYDKVMCCQLFPFYAW